MSTEAQRARNARKRAKLKEHRKALEGPLFCDFDSQKRAGDYHQPCKLWHVGVFGDRCTWQPEDSDVGDPYLNPAVFCEGSPEYISVCSWTEPEFNDSETLKAEVLEWVEANLGLDRQHLVAFIVDVSNSFIY